MEKKRIVVQISGEGMGRGEDQLGLKLTKSFLQVVNDLTPLPETIVFFNAGVKLVCEDSPVLDSLGKLREKGVRLLACSTCLNHFELFEKLAVAEASNMAAITRVMLEADRIIPL